LPRIHDLFYTTDRTLGCQIYDNVVH
jgi:hypothetical protein